MGVQEQGGQPLHCVIQWPGIVVTGAYGLNSSLCCTTPGVFCSVTPSYVYSVRETLVTPSVP